MRPVNNMGSAEINKKGIILTFVILASICYILYSNSDQIQSDSAVQVHPMLMDKEKGKFDKVAGDKETETGDSEEKDSDLEIGLEVEYIEDYILVDNINVFYSYAISTVKNQPPPRFAVLLLHGAAYDAFTWKSLGTLQFLAKSGYLPIAVDLPGFGKSKTEKNIGDKGEFLSRLILALPRMERPVIICPSMSGGYALPFVFEHRKASRGIIPIAPLNSYDEKAYKSLNLPALIFYGEKDKYGVKTSRILANIPKSIVVRIINGGHPAYLDDHVVFHNKVKLFLDDIYDKENSKRVK